MSDRHPAVGEAARIDEAEGAQALQPAASAPSLVYVSRRDDAEAIWHRAWVASMDPLTIGHAVGLCGRSGELDAGEFGRVWPFCSEQKPELGAMCSKCQRIAQLEEAWARFPNDAALIPHDGGVPATICRSRKCQAPVWRGVTRAKGKETYFDISPTGQFLGTNHWRTCLDREAFQQTRGTRS